MTDRTRSLERRDRPGWFALSVVLHLACAVALVFFTPIRDVLWEQSAVGGASSEPPMSTRQLTEVAERLDAITEDHIEQNVNAMRELLEQMQEVNDQQMAEYVVFEHSQIERTPEVVNDSLEQALAAMQQAIESIEADDHATAITQQALAMSHQESIQQRLELVQASPPVQQSQQHAIQVQEQAADENARADAAVRQIHEIEQRLRYPEQTIPTLEARVPQVELAVEAAADKVADYQAQLAEARRNLEQTRVAGDGKAIERADKLAERAAEAVARADRSHESKQNELVKLRERLQEYKSQVVELRQSRVEQQQIVDAAHGAALQQQAEALRLQTDVAEKIKQDVAERVAALRAELKPDQTVQQVLLEVVEVPNTREMNTLELYDAARAAEQQLTEKYRQGRAMRLAVLQDVPFSAALEAVDRVTPVRPELPAEALTADARSEDQLDEKKEAVRTAMAETNSMVELGHSLVSQAIAERGGAGAGHGAGRISLAAIQARSAQMQQLETLASQEASGKAVDVSQAMQAGGGAGSSDGGVDNEQSPPDASNIRDGGDETPPAVDRSIIPVAGRKVADDGDGAEWMAVTEWYMLGPFPNPGRANIDRVFPPESFIDLNAVYVGKDDRKIEWIFTRTDHELGRLQPTNDEPYGIWYAYTELRFDRARDLWITMGSDDKGRVWINDQLVWVSASHHKVWEPDEAQRRIHFRKGRNKILFRIENGQHGMVFSLWVHLRSTE